MKLALAIAAVVAVLAPEAAHADSLVRICSATGNCGVCDIAATAVTIGKWLITGAAGLALVVIVWASVGMATSGGNAEKIQEAKKQIVWAVLGVGLVFASFYLVMWIIIAFANPSNQFGYEPNPQDEGAVESAGLGRILDGTAWWNLCNEGDLRKKNDNPSSVENATADCKYWGDGTPCKSNRKSICFGGACVPAGTAEVQAKITALGGYPLPPDPSACDYLAAVDRVFENYSCQATTACNPEKIETGFCGGTQVCCEPTTYVPRVRPAAGAPGAVAAPTAPAPSAPAPTPGPTVCRLPYDSAEQASRNRIKAISGISINNGLDKNDFDGRWCGQSTYQDYRAACGKVGCTNVGGLQGKIFGYLETIKDECGNFTISGGSELGHSSTGGHSQGLAVDFKPDGTTYGRFLSCLKEFTFPSSPVSIKAICTIAGHEPYNCNDYRETEEHIHVSFN